MRKQTLNQSKSSLPCFLKCNITKSTLLLIWCCQKVCLFFSCLCVWYCSKRVTSQWSIPKWPFRQWCFWKNFWSIVRFVFLKALCFVFLAIELILKLSFGFSNIRNLTTQFALQRCSRFSNLQFIGPLWLLKVSPQTFIVKVVVVFIEIQTS